MSLLARDYADQPRSYAPHLPIGMGERCQATTPCAETGLPWTCTAAAGHDGDHAAYGLSNDEPGETWPQKPRIDGSIPDPRPAVPVTSQHPAYRCPACGCIASWPAHAGHCNRKPPATGETP
jgi:hypothetical protein